MYKITFKNAVGACKVDVFKNAEGLWFVVRPVDNTHRPDAFPGQLDYFSRLDFPLVASPNRQESARFRAHNPSFYGRISIHHSY